MAKRNNVLESTKKWMEVIPKLLQSENSQANTKSHKDKIIEKKNMHIANWIKCADELPPIETPVRVVFGGVVQNILYELIQCNGGDELRWLSQDDCCDTNLETFSHWMPKE